jgi:hypothetical protein
VDADLEDFFPRVVAMGWSKPFVAGRSGENGSGTSHREP